MCRFLLKFLLNCYSHYNCKNCSHSKTVSSRLCSLPQTCSYPGFSQYVFKDENNFTFIYLYVCASGICVSIHHVLADASRDQKRAQDHQELELQMVVSHQLGAGT